MLRRSLSRAPWAVALRYPAVRWLLVARLANSATMQMRTVAQGWLVYELTGSALALTWVAAARNAVMFVFALFGGFLSDRFPKRWVIFWGRLVLVLNYGVIGMLIRAGSARIWHIAVSSMVDGLVFALIIPAVGSLPAELVEKKHLLNTLSLLALASGLTSVFAATAAGIMIDQFGAWGVYLATSLLFAFIAYTMTKLPDGATADGARSGSPLRQIAEGLRYLSNQPVLISVLGMRLVRVLLYMPFRALLPAFVEEVLGMGATGLGLMLSMSSVGALLASASLTALGNRLPKGRTLIWSGVITGISMVLLVTVRAIPLPYLWILFAGGLGSLTMVLVNAVIQMRSEPEYRGRVSGVRMMIMGMQPLGSLPAGALADLWGSEWIIGAQGILMVIGFGLIGRLRPELRRIK